MISDDTINILNKILMPILAFLSVLIGWLAYKKSKEGNESISLNDKWDFSLFALNIGC